MVIKIDFKTIFVDNAYSRFCDRRTDGFIEGRLEYAIVDLESTPFDWAKKTLEKKGYGLISLEHIAKLRLHEGARQGGFVREGFIYIPKKGTFLTKKSPIISSPERATKCHKTKRIFKPTKRQIEEALSDSCKVTNKIIPTSRFGDEKFTKYAFGEYAKDYGKFLRHEGIQEIHLEYSHELSKEAYATQAYICSEFRIPENDPKPGSINLNSHSQYEWDCYIDYRKKYLILCDNENRIFDGYCGEIPKIYGAKKLPKLMPNPAILPKYISITQIK